jgi:hypothetical protein
MEKNQTSTNIKKKTNKNKDVVVLYLTLVLSCIVLYFLVKPLYVEKMSLENDIILKNEDLRNKQDLLTNIERFNSENSNLAVDLERLTLFISKRNNYEDVIDYLDNLARENNLAIAVYSITAQDGVKPTETVESASASVPVEGEAGTANSANSSAIKKQELSIEIQGDYASFINFIKSLENGVPFFQEGSISISADSTEEDGVAGGGEEEQAQEEQTVNTNPTLNFALDLDFVHY